MAQIRSPFDLYSTWLNFGLMAFFQLVMQEQEYDLLPPGSDFIRDLVEMNTFRPEDLDEQGKSSITVAKKDSKVSLVVFIAIFIY